MTFLIVVGILFGALFLLAYATKRRFGVLTLALSAGAILAGLWSHELTPYIANLGIVVVRPPLVDIISLILTLAPSLILLFSGPSADKKLQRIGGSAVFALLAVALMFETLKNALVIDDFGQKIIGWVEPYLAIVVTVCLILALVDVLQTHSRRSISKKH